MSILYQDSEEKKSDNLETNLHQNEESAIYFNPSIDQNQTFQNRNPILNPLDTGFEINSTTTSTATTTSNS